MNAHKTIEYPKWDKNSGTLPRGLHKEWFNKKNKYWVVKTINNETLEYHTYIDSKDALNKFTSLAKNNKPVGAHAYHNFNIMMSHIMDTMKEYKEQSIWPIKEVVIHDYTYGYVY